MNDAIVEHDLEFRRIPAGSFLMGSEDGDPDERPVHEVDVPEFWLSATTVSWFDYARLMGWDLPPYSFPPESERAGLDKAALFHLMEANKIRMQYCEDQTLRARNWHAHDPKLLLGSRPAAEVFGRPRRALVVAYRYEAKPMIAVSWHEAREFGAKLSTSAVTYRLPTEAEWEKAARGGLIGKRYAWGDEPPTPERCDFGRFDAFAIQPSRSLPPNAYGLHAMCGSVWEWTLDAYDALGYTGAIAPERPASRDGKRVRGPEYVLRGGSWADGAEACTVSFRASRGSHHWLEAEWGPGLTPNIGFRLARIGPAD